MTNHSLDLTELISTYNIGNEGKKQCSESDKLAAVEIILSKFLHSDGLM